jgi:hypothetical protein
MTKNDFLFSDQIWPDFINYDYEIEELPNSDGFLIVPNSVINSALFFLTGFTLGNLRVKSREKKMVEARQIGMIFYRLNGNSWGKSGNTFHRNHATAINSLKTITNYYGMKGEENITEFIDKMSKLTGIEFRT